MIPTSFPPEGKVQEAQRAALLRELAKPTQPPVFTPGKTP